MTNPRFTKKIPVNLSIPVAVRRIGIKNAKARGMSLSGHVVELLLGSGVESVKKPN